MDSKVVRERLRAINSILKGTSPSEGAFLIGMPCDKEKCEHRKEGKCRIQDMRKCPNKERR